MRTPEGRTEGRSVNRSLVCRIYKKLLTFCILAAVAIILVFGLSSPYAALAYQYEGRFDDFQDIIAEGGEGFDGVLDFEFTVDASNNFFPGLEKTDKSDDSIDCYSSPSSFYLTAGQSLTIHPADGEARCDLYYSLDVNTVVRITGQGWGSYQPFVDAIPAHTDYRNWVFVNNNGYKMYEPSSEWVPAHDEITIQVLYGQVEITDLTVSGNLGFNAANTISISRGQFFNGHPIRLNTYYAAIKAGENLALSVEKNELSSICEELESTESDSYYGIWAFETPGCVNREFNYINQDEAGYSVEAFNGLVTISQDGTVWVDPAILDEENRHLADSFSEEGLLVTYGWVNEEDGDGNPNAALVSRECLLVLDPVLADSPQDPDKPTQSVPADDKLVQFAVSALSGFDLLWVNDNVPVSAFIESSSFEEQDTEIWSGSAARYSDLFRSVLGGYTIVKHSSAGDKYIAVRNNKTGDIVVAYDPRDMLNNIKKDIKLAADLWNSNSPEIFDEALRSYDALAKEFPNATIYPTGYFLGGMAASYVATVTGIRTNVFDGLPDLAIRTAYLTQASTMDIDKFCGKEYPLVTNWYNGENDYYRIFDAALDFLPAGEKLANSRGLSPNPSGDERELSCLLALDADGNFCITDHVVRQFDVNEEMFAENVDTIKSCLGSINKTVLSFLKGAPAFDMGFLNDGPRLVIGTSSDDSVYTGRGGLKKQYDKKQIMYSGEGNDYFIGSEKADVFVLGAGYTDVTGGPGADTYVISGNAKGEISDSMCASGLVLASGMEDFMKGFARLSKGSVSGIGSFVSAPEKIVEGLALSSQDTLVFVDCPLAEIKVAEDKFGLLEGAYCILQAGNARIKVYKKLFASKDFKVMGGDGEWTNLNTLLRGRGDFQPYSALEDGNESLDGVVTFDSYVFAGSLVISSTDDGVLREFSFEKDFRYTSEWGNFYYNKEHQYLSAAFDADAVKVSFKDVDFERAFVNSTKSNITDFQFVDFVSGPEVHVVVKGDNSVCLYANDEEIPMLPIEEEAVYVSSVTLNKDSVDLVGASSSQLIANVFPEDAMGSSCAWESSDKSVVAVDENGKITAVGKGTAVVSATTRNGKKATCSVTVSNPATRAKLSPATINVARGNTIEAKLALSGDLPGEVDEAGDFDWKVEDASVASVKQDGDMVFITGEAVGSTTVLGSINVNGATLTVSAEVVVAKPVPGSVLLDCYKKTVSVGDSPFRLTAAVNPEDAEYAFIKWESSNPHVATVSQDGNVTIAHTGSTVIKASAGGEFASCLVTVEPCVIFATDDSALEASVEVTAANLASLLKGARLEIIKINLEKEEKFNALFEGFGGLHVGQYDIRFVDERGDLIEWSDRDPLIVKIRLTNKEIKNTGAIRSLAVHYIDDGLASKENMNAIIDGDNVVFSTTHFSNYAITVDGSEGISLGDDGAGEGTEGSRKGDLSLEGISPMPETGDCTPLLGVMLMLMCSLAFLSVACCRFVFRKKPRHAKY